MVLNKRTLMMKANCTPAGIRKAPGGATCTKMKVYIRVRPSNEREKMSDKKDIIKLYNENVLEFDPKSSQDSFFFRGVRQNMRDITKKQNKEMKFTFDRVYGPTSTNEDVYNGSIKSIFASLLEGYNCSVFVYGATGAGKTYTMLGNDGAHGIIHHTMEALYKEIENIKDHSLCNIGISYLEVYNENVHDLLEPSKGALHLREDSVNGVVVAGMKVVEIKDVKQLFDLLRSGNSNRTQHPTDANAESSRSHAVFQVFIRIENIESSKVQLVKLSMIDLAGSERGAATNCKGIRFKEGANINKSLLALGNCINNLADGVRHIPYRDSKLTRLLKDSLSGNCQTVMIACIGPTMYSYEDTYNTLKYASRASTIKTKISKNIVSNNDMNFQKIQMDYEKLKKEYEELKKSVSMKPNAAFLIGWITKINLLYASKGSINRDLLMLESKLKITSYKLKYDDSCALHESEDFMKGTLVEYRTKFTQLWKQNVGVNENLNSLRKEIEKENLLELLDVYFNSNHFKIECENSKVQQSHYAAMIKLILNTNQTHNGTTKTNDAVFQNNPEQLTEFLTLSIDSLQSNIDPLGSISNVVEIVEQKSIQDSEITHATFVMPAPKVSAVAPLLTSTTTNTTPDQTLVMPSTLTPSSSGSSSNNTTNATFLVPSIPTPSSQSSTGNAQKLTVVKQVSSTEKPYVRSKVLFKTNTNVKPKPRVAISHLNSHNPVPVKRINLGNSKENTSSSTVRKPTVVLVKRLQSATKTSSNVSSVLKNSNSNNTIL